MNPQVSKILWSIQYLRALAALNVVFGHSWGQLPWFMAKFPREIGIAGVDLFFVISGFVIVYVTGNSPQTWQHFIRSRFIRIVPIYWFYTFATAALIIAVPRLFSSNELTLPHFILSLLFIPHPNPADPSLLLPLVKLGWTLNYEMYFYLVFTFAMFLGRDRRVMISMAFLIFVMVLGLVPTSSYLRIVNFYASTVVSEFMFGMLIAVAFLSCAIHRIKLFFGIILIAIGMSGAYFGSAYVGSLPRALIFGIPSVLIVVGALAVEATSWMPKSTFLLLLGNASYSIYLAHLFPIAIQRFFWKQQALSAEGWAMVLIFVSISIALGVCAGCASYLLIERPMLSLFRRCSFTPRPKAT